MNLKIILFTALNYFSYFRNLTSRLSDFKTLFTFFSFESNFSKKEIKKLFDSVTWYHTFNINHVINNKTNTSLQYQMWAAQNIPDDLSGKSVLDLGCADGFYSFLAESRGAKRVVAVDFMKWDGFDVAKKLLDSKVEHKILRVEHLHELEEKFDVVFFFGVYYHLANPVDALQKIFLKVNERAFLAGHIIDSSEPLMCYYDEFEMHPDDSSNMWAASPSCITKMAKRVGFRDAELVDRLYQREMLNVQSDEAKSGIRRLGHIGVFEFIK
jgi:tRNA (mo5U34)-methyltransferase